MAENDDDDDFWAKLAAIDIGPRPPGGWITWREEVDEESTQEDESTWSRSRFASDEDEDYELQDDDGVTASASCSSSTSADQSSNPNPPFTPLRVDDEDWDAEFERIRLAHNDPNADRSAQVKRKIEHRADSSDEERGDDLVEWGLKMTRPKYWRKDHELYPPKDSSSSTPGPSGSSTSSTSEDPVPLPEMSMTMDMDTGDPGAGAATKK